MSVHVFNIKALRKINCIMSENKGITYYRSPTMLNLKENKIKETNILEKIFKKPRNLKRKPEVIAANYPLSKKLTKLFKIIVARDVIMKSKIKSQIQSEIFRHKLNKIAKLIIYYFARGLYFQMHGITCNSTNDAKTTNYL